MTAAVLHAGVAHPPGARRGLMAERASKANYWVPILGHAIRTLEVFDDADTRLSLQEVTARVHISKSSAFRILFTLENLGYIRRDAATRKYCLGLRVLEIAKRVTGTRNVVHIARPYMRDLQNRFAETVNLACVHSNDLFYVEIAESHQAFRMSADVGSRAPLHASAVGKAIAAFLPKKDLTALLAGKRFTRFTPNTVTSVKAFTAELAKVRRRGYSQDNEEVERGASCIAVPLLDEREHATHAISISGPTHRVQPKRDDIVRELLRVSAVLRRELE
jgi:IclR family KDG regulon transcriptional repressor